VHARAVRRTRAHVWAQVSTHSRHLYSRIGLGLGLVQFRLLLHRQLMRLSLRRQPGILRGLFVYLPAG
jgi:hypothetical protein